MRVETILGHGGKEKARERTKAESLWVLGNRPFFCRRQPSARCSVEKALGRPCLRRKGAQPRCPNPTSKYPSYAPSGAKSGRWPATLGLPQWHSSRRAQRPKCVPEPVWQVSGALVGWALSLPKSLFGGKALEAQVFAMPKSLLASRVLRHKFLRCKIPSCIPSNRTPSVRSYKQQISFSHRRSFCSLERTSWQKRSAQTGPRNHPHVSKSRMLFVSVWCTHGWESKPKIFFTVLFFNMKADWMDDIYLTLSPDTDTCQGVGRAFKSQVWKRDKGHFFLSHHSPRNGIKKMFSAKHVRYVQNVCFVGYVRCICFVRYLHYVSCVWYVCYMSSVQHVCNMWCMVCEFFVLCKV